MPENSAKPKVLVADDERVIADTLAMILNQSGFEARAVYSGERALELAVSFSPDMLISDVIMGDLNGIDTAIQMRALLPKIKIETVVPDDRKDEVTRAISSAARSGKIGDGKIFVFDVAEAIRIRNDDTGELAL